MENYRMKVITWMRASSRLHPALGKDLLSGFFSALKVSPKYSAAEKTAFIESFLKMSSWNQSEMISELRQMGILQRQDATDFEIKKRFMDFYNRL